MAAQKLRFRFKNKKVVLERGEGRRLLGTKTFNFYFLKLWRLIDVLSLALKWLASCCRRTIEWIAVVSLKLHQNLMED